MAWHEEIFQTSEELANCIWDEKINWMKDLLNWIVPDWLTDDEVTQLQVWWRKNLWDLSNECSLSLNKALDDIAIESWLIQARLDQLLQEWDIPSLFWMQQELILMARDYEWSNYEMLEWIIESFSIELYSNSMLDGWSSRDAIWIASTMVNLYSSLRSNPERESEWIVREDDAEKQRSEFLSNSGDND